MMIYLQFALEVTHHVCDVVLNDGCQCRGIEATVGDPGWELRVPYAGVP